MVVCKCEELLLMLKCKAMIEPEALEKLEILLRLWIRLTSDPVHSAHVGWHRTVRHVRGCARYIDKVRIRLMPIRVALGWLELNDFKLKPYQLRPFRHRVDRLDELASTRWHCFSSEDRAESRQSVGRMDEQERL